jgi:hypothetical protein
VKISRAILKAPIGLLTAIFLATGATARYDGAPTLKDAFVQQWLRSV